MSKGLRVTSMPTSQVLSHKLQHFWQRTPTGSAHQQFAASDMSGVSHQLVAPGTVIRQFSETEAEHLADDWLAVFGHSRQGANTKAYLWHVFSGARYPSIAGPAALERYRLQTGAEFVVLSNDRRLAFLTERLPESSTLSDYLVFPPNFAWTMAFTHEDGWLGPYFARHPHFDQLNEANQAKLKKVREKEAAQRKGWYRQDP